MPALPIDEATVQRQFDRAGAARWQLEIDVFAAALCASASKAFGGDIPGARELGRYLDSLHAEDLALACACAAGHAAAWEHFVLEFRPVLYRSADAIDPTGGARELADSLYADLYGLTEREGARQSLFRYFHGRSSLATWLRAVLAQRHVDRLRAGRRMEPMPEPEAPSARAAPAAWSNPERTRYVALVRQGLGRALAGLEARDRLRISCYYGQEMTLAQIGRLLGEHEATVSRNLARTRKAIRQDVEQYLRAEAGLTDAAVEECFQSVVDDAGPIDLNEMLAAGDDRKTSGSLRSK